MIDPETLTHMAKIVLTNEDYNFKAFLKVFHEKKIFQSGPNALRCKKAAVSHAFGSRFKKSELEFCPYEGTYSTIWKDKTFYLNLQRKELVLTTECRQIDYVTVLTIYGENLQITKQFTTDVLSEVEVGTDTITIYENNSGHWMVSKEKKPRKMESVIFKPEFTQAVLNDVDEFINSEEWYTEMGIPYKRSYLLYGPPGTGKSSFAQALAGQIGFSICFVNCSDKVNDFQFNTLLNRAPKQSIILIEDVDSIFSERKNTEKNNSLTFSGFLNSIDGVRSQEGRILIMTTNYKERLDPALLRPGRVDEMYEISLASRFQIEKLCYRFYKNEKLAKELADQLPEHKFSMSMIQGFLLKYRKSPEKILQCISDILDSDENVKIDRFLEEINCSEVLNDFKIEECYSLASARNLPKDVLEKMIVKLNPLKKGRLLETIRQDRKTYLKTDQHLQIFVEENYKDEQLQRDLKEYIKDNSVKTFYQIRDKAKELQELQEKKEN